MPKVSNPLVIESIRPAIAELERVAQWTYGLYSTVGRDDTTPITIVIQTRGKKSRCNGWFDANRWSTREGQLVHEISVAAEIFHKTTPEIVEVVVHETVHLINQDAGIKDTSRGGRHNREFKVVAESLGLLVGKPFDSYGYGYTHLSPDLERRILQDLKPDVAAFNIARQALEAKTAPTTPKTPRTAAYVCGGRDCATVRVAVGKAFNATCNICGREFTPRNKNLK